ncbi:MAG: hypothetical protein V3V18_12910 [Methylococcales bacterium]
MLKKIALGALLLASFVSASASVMTFDNLKDYQSEPYSENGMTATSDLEFSTWPAPGIVHLDSVHTHYGIGPTEIYFTFSEGLFDLIAVDISDGGPISLLSDVNTPDVLAVNNVLWEAFIGDTLVYSQITSSLTANTIHFGNGFRGIDRARVSVIGEFEGQNGTLSNAILSDFSIDNVSFQAATVPIPAAAWLFGSGLIGIFLKTRKTNQA